MLPDAKKFLDGVNLITGPGRACGKTAFAQAAALSLRKSGKSFALISVGVEGSGAGREGPGTDLIVSLARGEVFITASGFLGAATCLPEILDVLPGESALGQLVIARASRFGKAILAGPERNEYLRWAVERIVGEGWATTVIVDGALNRITQAASLRSARLFYALRVDASNQRSMAGKLRYLHRLISLASFGDIEKDLRPGQSVSRIKGPLTASMLGGMASDVKVIVVEDFSKIFLDERELTDLMKKRALAVASPVEFGGISIALRSVRREDFEMILGEKLNSLVISWDAYSETDTKEMADERI